MSLEGGKSRRRSQGLRGGSRRLSVAGLSRSPRGQQASRPGGYRESDARLTGMSRYRSTRPDPRSKLTAPFLLRIAEIAERHEDGRFPFTLPFMRRGGRALHFTHPVTLLVGEDRPCTATLLAT